MYSTGRSIARSSIGYARVRAVCRSSQSARPTQRLPVATSHSKCLSLADLPGCTRGAAVLRDGMLLPILSAPAARARNTHVIMPRTNPAHHPEQDTHQRSWNGFEAGTGVVTSRHDGDCAALCSQTMRDLT
jgi:hypothetical protein